ncbi:MAG: hypothetical protein KA419_12660 [Acidobacteria bacterium]|nr:hypothetical protein [Acidobacteriota bacterium]
MPYPEAVFKCRMFRPIEGLLRERWADLLAGLEGALEEEVHAAVIAGEVLGALAGTPAIFVKQVRDVGICWEHYAFRVEAAGMAYCREWAEQLGESGQCCERTLDAWGWEGLPSGIILSVKSDGDLSPTWTVHLGGVPPEVETRVEKVLRQRFRSVRR